MGLLTLALRSAADYLTEERFTQLLSRIPLPILADYVRANACAIHGGWFLDGDTVWLRSAPQVNACAPCFGHMLASFRQPGMHYTTAVDHARKRLLNYASEPFDGLFVGTPWRLPTGSPLARGFCDQLDRLFNCPRTVEYNDAMHAFRQLVTEWGLECAVCPATTFSPLDYWMPTSLYFKAVAGKSGKSKGSDAVADAVAVNAFWQSSRHEFAYSALLATWASIQQGSMWHGIFCKALPEGLPGVWQCRAEPDGAGPRKTGPRGAAQSSTVLCGAVPGRAGSAGPCGSVCSRAEATREPADAGVALPAGGPAKRGALRLRFKQGHNAVAASSAAEPAAGGNCRLQQNRKRRRSPMAACVVAAPAGVTAAGPPELAAANAGPQHPSHTLVTPKSRPNAPKSHPSHTQRTLVTPKSHPSHTLVTPKAPEAMRASKALSEAAATPDAAISACLKPAAAPTPAAATPAATTPAAATPAAAAAATPASAAAATPASIAMPTAAARPASAAAATPASIGGSGFACSPAAALPPAPPRFLGSSSIVIRKSSMIRFDVETF